MSKELRPCPFCGEKVTLDYRVMPNRKHWFITCDCCGMMYQDTLSQRKYVKDGWNTRPIEDNLIARIVELEAENEKTNYFFRRLRMFCIFAHWDNPNTEAEFCKVDAEISEYLSEYKSVS